MQEDKCYGNRIKRIELSGVVALCEVIGQRQAGWSLRSEIIIIRLLLFRSGRWGGKND